MQSFKEIDVDETIHDSRTTINDSIKTVMSNSSGKAFPTTNLQAGMKCYRTDLGKTYTLTDVANKTWKEDNHATLADSANKLSGLTVAGSNDSQAITNKIPKIDGSGVMEVGKCIDFHSTNNQTTSYTTRITAEDNGTISVSGGINANLNGNASSASSVPWTGVTGKPSTYPPASHNHDSAYPATNGSRATGTWGINITGNASSASSVPWTGVTGKPSTYPPSSHNHDSAYPATNGSRATGTWGINITGNASSASSVPWTGVTGKPSTYPPSAHNHGLRDSDFTARVGGDKDDTWGAIGIINDGFVLKSIRTEIKAPYWLSPDFSSGIAFGGSDTKGVISMSYRGPRIKFAGGNGNKPSWYCSLLGTSGKEYNLDNLAGAGIVSQQLESNGYIKYGNGLIIQWGKHLPANYGWVSSQVNFPIAFNSACFAVNVSVIIADNDDRDIESSVHNLPGLTSFSLYYSARRTRPIFWTAIGY